MTQREQFEAWAKSQSLDTDHKEKDAWGREQYSPHIHSMWQGWQAAQAQAAVEPVAWMFQEATYAEGDVRGRGWKFHQFSLSKPDRPWMQDAVTPLYTSPPDAFMNGFEGGKQEARDAAHAEIDSMKAAMRLALEALNNSVDLVWEEYTEAERSYGNYPTRRAKLDGMKAMAQQHDAAIAALEGALK